MRSRFKIFVHKLKHPEYWPMWTFYISVSPLWVYKAIRHRNPYVFRFANPSLVGKEKITSSKSLLYDMLPVHSYPVTLKFVNPEIKEVLDKMKESGIEFPIIAKPDNGYRGIGVEKIYDVTSLRTYLNKADGFVLIQEFIDFPLEAGVFYIKDPISKRGRITSITEKKFLEVKGDGLRNLNDLISEYPRALIQYGRLRKIMDFTYVPKKGEAVILEEIGSHNRGTKFIDRSELISSELAEKIDSLANSIPGFYYGRFDLRFESWEDLQLGRNFKIIEVNDSFSEPIHIYDEKYGFFFAQREMLKYHKEMFRIASHNLKSNRIKARSSERIPASINQNPTLEPFIDQISK